jgi:cytidine deaminase
MVNNYDLIQAAAAVLNPRIMGDFMTGDVGCALISESNTMYRGVCIDVSSSMGFCAEHAAIAAMVTAGEFKIKTIVAVWRHEDSSLYVLPPCGRCREFMRQIDPANFAETDVILGVDQSVKLSELLPYSEWNKVD